MHLVARHLTNPTAQRMLVLGAVAALLLAGHATLPADEAAKPRFVLSWGKKGDKAGEFHSPIGIVITPKAEVFVTDLNNARVQKFTADGKHLGGFDLPRDDPNAGNQRVQKFAVPGLTSAPKGP